MFIQFGSFQIHSSEIRKWEARDNEEENIYSIVFEIDKLQSDDKWTALEVKENFKTKEARDRRMMQINKIMVDASKPHFFSAFQGGRN